MSTDNTVVITTLDSVPPRPTSPLDPHPWQSFGYSFGHYAMDRITQSYRIPFDKLDYTLGHYLRLLKHLNVGGN